MNSSSKTYFWIIWSPVHNQYFLKIDDFPQTRGQTCKICKKGLKVGDFYRSKILLSKDIDFTLPTNLYSLNTNKSKISNKFIQFPLLGDEWSIILSKNHKLRFDEIREKDWFKAITNIINETKSRILSGKTKHVLCISPQNFLINSTFYHPQIRCFSFPHKILLSIYSVGNFCYFCKLLNEDMLDEKIFELKNFVAFKSILGEEKTIFIAPKKHLTIYNFSESDMRAVSKILKHVASKVFEKNEQIIILFEFVEDKHFNIRIKGIPDVCEEAIFSYILSDLAIKVILPYK